MTEVNTFKGTIIIIVVNKLCRRHGIPPTAVASVTVERFHINHVALATVALICLVTLTFDFLISKYVHGLFV